MRMQLWAVAGTLALAGTVVATAQERRAPRRGGPDPAAIEAELGLSADQAAQLKKLRADGRKQAIRQRADLAVARIELEELMEAPTVDDKAVAAKVKAVSDLQAAALQARTDQRLAMRRILSPEQQEKLKQLKRRGRMERAGRRGERGPGRPGRGAPPPPGPGGAGLDESDEPPALEPMP